MPGNGVASLNLNRFQGLPGSKSGKSILLAAVTTDFVMDHEIRRLHCGAVASGQHPVYFVGDAGWVAAAVPLFSRRARTESGPGRVTFARPRLSRGFPARFLGPAR